jgi:hypothetical protein
LDHVDLLGRANQPHRGALFVRDEAVLVDQCTRLRFTPAVRMVGYWCQRVDTDTEPDGYGRPDDAVRRDDAVRLHASVTIGGTVVIDGVLDAVGGAILTNELHRLEHDLYLADQRDGTLRSPAARRAGALVAMAQRSAIPGPGRAPRPLFTVLVGDRAFTELCELTNDTIVTPRQLAPWLDSAVLETILFDGPSTVVSVSHRRRFTGAVRRAIQVRDRHCQHPSGCDVPAEHCDIDHIIPHSRGGPTSQFNGRLECTPHNRHTDLHDHDATAPTARPITRLDELRARIRWRIIHDHPQDDEPALGLSP